jgi:hypothetical protein
MQKNNVVLPPKPEDLREPFEDNWTHFFHGDDWHNEDIFRWDKDKFFTFADRLAFVNHYSIFYDVPTEEVRFFFLKDQYFTNYYPGEKFEEYLAVTQYFAFHSNFPQAWMTYINWEEEISGVDITQVHFHCPAEIRENAKNAIQKQDHLTAFTVQDQKNNDDIRQLLKYGSECLFDGVFEIWYGSPCE